MMDSRNSTSVRDVSETTAAALAVRDYSGWIVSQAMTREATHTVMSAGRDTGENLQRKRMRTNGIRSDQQYCVFIEFRGYRSLLIVPNGSTLNRSCLKYSQPGAVPELFLVGEI
ncbi:MAG: hypothetical protein ACLP5H_23635 [Desulfomonilaceae bacterium]